MPQRPRILVLCAKESMARGIVESLGHFEVDVSAAVDLKDAILRLKDHAFDMLIAESELGSRSGLSFLAEAHKRLPSMLRVVIENAPISVSMHSLVNDVAPSAIFPGMIDPKKVIDLLRVTQASDASSSLDEEDDSSVGLSEMGKLELLTDASAMFTAMIEDPDIVLPVLPEIASQLRAIMANEQADFEAIAEMVETEQAISARILQVANSPIYAGLERIRNIQQAVGRLGMRETYNILQAVIAENLFKTENSSIEQLMKDLWLHSLATAYSNEMIARKLEIQQSEDYFMMGLLHDIGKLLIFHLTEMGIKEGRWGPQGLPQDVLHKLLAMRHNDLGARLLEKWDYPMVFRDIVRLHDDETNIERRSEPVIVTYFSNLLTRKVGFSLLPYEGDPLSNKALADALNMSGETRDAFEVSIRVMTDKIKTSCFAQ
jgi:putative nucleotidyltransferase with HDIG domain